jgi:hypothetical protein
MYRGGVNRTNSLSADCFAKEAIRYFGPPTLD